MPRIMCHHHSISDSDREFMINKVNRLKKFYDRIHEVSIILDAEKHTREAEILLWGPHLNLRVKGEADDVRTAFEAAVNKAERWLRKTKEKLWGDKMHRGMTIRRFQPEEVFSAVSVEEEAIEAEAKETMPVERLEPKYMTLEEARQQMDSLEGILVFINSETQEINILHRNKSNQIELLELGEMYHAGTQGNPDLATG